MVDAPPTQTENSPPLPADATASRRHPDFSRAVLEDLYRYPQKHYRLTVVLWALTGLVGGHRFYLDRPLTGLLMLCTGGGAVVWWLVDLFLLRDMVHRFNEDQTQRQAAGLPPSALSFMPPARGATLPPSPTWISKRGGRRRLFADLIVLVAAGVGAGAFASSTGTYEPVVTTVALCAITLLGARWDTLADIPILRSFDRWSHRLRLFYYTNDPGGPLQLFFRPIVGLVSAPFRKRARAEAWLYLQLGVWFTVLFSGLDLLEVVTISTAGITVHPADLLVDGIMTFGSVYALAAPIGAILTTQMLLEKRDRVVWLLTAATLAAMLVGLRAAG